MPPRPVGCGTKAWRSLGPGRAGDGALGERVPRLDPTSRPAPPGIGWLLDVRHYTHAGGCLMAAKFRDDKPKPAPPPGKKADFSNVRSGSSSTAPAPAPAEKIYVVKSGDNLSKIAKAEYGDAAKWKKIF